MLNASTRKRLDDRFLAARPDHYRVPLGIFNQHGNT